MTEFDKETDAKPQSDWDGYIIPLTIGGPRTNKIFAASSRTEKASKSMLNFDQRVPTVRALGIKVECYPSMKKLGNQPFFQSLVKCLYRP